MIRFLATFSPGILLAVPLFWLWPKSIYCFKESRLLISNLKSFKNIFSCHLEIIDKKNQKNSFPLVFIGDKIQSVLPPNEYHIGTILLYGNTIAAYGNGNIKVYSLEDFIKIWQYDFSMPSNVIFPPLGGFLLSLVSSSLITDDPTSHPYGHILSWNFFYLFILFTILIFLCKTFIIIYIEYKLKNIIKSL